MDEQLNMKVRCPYCDKFLLETDSANMKVKCSCKRELIITVDHGRVLITLSDSNSKESYSQLVNRQLNYVCKVASVRNVGLK